MKQESDLKMKHTEPMFWEFVAASLLVLLVSPPLPLRADCWDFTFNNADIETPAAGAVADNWTSYSRLGATANFAISGWSSTGTRSQLIQVRETTGGCGIYQDITSVTPGAVYKIDVIEYPNSTSATAEVRISVDGGTDYETATSLWVDNTASPKTMSGTVTAAFTSMRIWLDTSVSTVNKAVYWDAVTVDCYGPQSIHWATGDGTWDIDTTQNWISEYGFPCTFYNSDLVVFQDTDSGSSPITITLATTVNPVYISMTASKNFTISGSGAIAGSTGVIKDGTGTLTLSTANTFSGNTRIVDGTLTLGHSSALAGSTLNMNSRDSGALNFADSLGMAILGGLKASRNLTLTDENGGAVALRIGGNGANTTYLGVLGGAGGFMKTGAGTLTLTGVNTYVGTTTVSEGKLMVRSPGSLAAASAVTVASGATLGGDGTLDGPVTIEADGILSPGTSVGTLAFGGDLTLAGDLLIDVDKSLSPSNDVMTVVGMLTNAGTGTVTVTNLGPGLAVGDSFQLFNQPVLNGEALTVVSAGGVEWTNRLAVDGSIAVVTTPPAPAPATNLTIAAVGPTSFSLGGWGATNSAYDVYAATNVTMPMTNWWLLGITNSDGSGAIQFLDSQATNEQRFYRFGQ